MEANLAYKDVHTRIVKAKPRRKRHRKTLVVTIRVILTIMWSLWIAMVLSMFL